MNKNLLAENIYIYLCCDYITEKGVYEVHIQTVRISLVPTRSGHGAVKAGPAFVSNLSNLF